MVGAISTIKPPAAGDAVARMAAAEVIACMTLAGPMSAAWFVFGENSHCCVFVMRVSSMYILVTIKWVQ